MEKLTLCIPTMVTYKLCHKLIKSASMGIVKPDAYRIVDNGGGFNVYLKKNPLPPGLDIHIHTPGKNIGVSSAWNHFLKTNTGILIISNDDIEAKTNTIQRMITTYYAKKADSTTVLLSAGGLGAFSFFMVNSNIQKRIGLFDEHFYPAYFEDNDYMRRMSLLGLKQYIIPDLPIIHHGSATLKEQKRLGQAKSHDANFRRNRTYFMKKWGGMPGKEKFTKPFNK